MKSTFFELNFGLLLDNDHPRKHIQNYLHYIFGSICLDSYWRIPKLLDILNYESKGENIGKIRN